MAGKNLGVSYWNKWGFLMLVLAVMVWNLNCQNTGGHPSQVLAIGDSNGAAKDGWVNQLKKLMPNDSIYNVSIPGNTLGFDNLDNPKLNTLHNLNQYLKHASNNHGYLDHVIILLGTNDSKAVFDGREREVLENLKSVITGIREFSYPKPRTPNILLVTPPPYGPDSLLAEKYQGGSKRVAYLVKEYQNIAKKMDCDFLDIHAILKEDFQNRSKDGVHLDSLGQQMIAKAIEKRIKE